MGLSKKHMRIITGLLTDHLALNRNLTVMKIHTDLLCHKCGEEDESANHFLSRCSAMMMARYSIFGSYLMDITKLQQVQPHTLLRNKSLKEIYITFRLSRGCALGQNWLQRYSLNARQHAVLPESKGKGGPVRRNFLLNNCA